MENRHYHKTNNYNECMGECEMEAENECCPTDPDLLLLRQNAKGEREAIAFYLKAASNTTGPLCQLFLDTARDEMTHFRKSMALLAKYDSIQARAFDKLGIDLPCNEFRKNQSTSNYCSKDKQEIIDLLTKSITGELDAINMYQESYEKACHDDVKALFCNNAHDEKMHVAEFWEALMYFTRESQ
jgi:rubrerythrin